MWGFRARLTRGNLLCEINKREGGGVCCAREMRVEGVCVLCERRAIFENGL